MNGKTITYPFINKAPSVERCMLDVIIALVPLLAWSVYIFGARVLVIALISVVSALLAQLLFSLAAKRRAALGDMSVFVTGLVTAMLMPVSVPLYYPAIAASVGIIFGKMIFGGLSKNVFNPAAVGIAFMLTAFGEKMNVFVQPFSRLAPFTVILSDSQLSGVLTGTTALELLKADTVDSSSVAEKIYGLTAGNIGEISALLIIISFIYLLVRRVVTPHTTIIYLGSLFVLTVLYAYSISFEEPYIYSLTHVFSGSAVFTGVFLMNDWTSVPITRNGKIYFALGCALITCVMRIYCDTPDGCIFAVLIMNAFTPMLESATRRPVFGKFYR